MTKISLPFIVISNRIVHPLVVLGPDFKNSGILDSTSKTKNHQILRSPKFKFEN